MGNTVNSGDAMAILNALEVYPQDRTVEQEAPEEYRDGVITLSFLPTKKVEKQKKPSEIVTLEEMSGLYSTAQDNILQLFLHRYKHSTAHHSDQN